MSYIKEPPKDLVIDKVFLSTIYILMALGSLALWLLTPASPGTVIPVWVLDAAGGVGVVGCLVAVFGVYRFNLLTEMTAIWIGVVGVLAYFVTSLFLIPDTPTRASFSIFLAIPVAFVNWRSWRLRRDAKKEQQAKAHEAVIEAHLAGEANG